MLSITSLARQLGFEPWALSGLMSTFSEQVPRLRPFTTFFLTEQTFGVSVLSVMVQAGSWPTTVKLAFTLRVSGRVGYGYRCIAKGVLRG